ncbi:MAG: hypothetical protein ABSB36_07130 [Candidatus Dormibacteria bacterium]|jgi:hypothetical protein
MANRLIYVGQDDDISDLAGKLQAADPGDHVALTVPAGAQAFQTALNVRLLRSVAMKRGLSTTIVSPDPRIQEAAQRAGLVAFSSVAAFEGGIPVEAPRPGFRPAESSPHPHAPFLPDRPEVTAATPGVAGVAAAPPFEYVPHPIPPATAAGAELYGSPSPAGTVPPGAGANVPGAVPAPRTGPWGAPIVPPRPPAPLEHALPAAPPRAPFLPASPAGAPAPPGSRWNALSDIPDDEDGPVSPWRGAGAVLAPAAAAGMIGAPAPSAPGAVIPPPLSRTGLASRNLPPPPPPASAGGRFRLPSRRVIYGAVVGLVALGVILFLLLGTSATVTLTVAEQPLTVSPTIQGTTSTAQAGQANYIPSKQITDTASQTFQASPTGTQQIAATQATGDVVLTANGDVAFSYGGSTPLLFQTSAGVQFETTGSGSVFLYPGNFQSSPIPVQALVASTSGDVGANTITDWVNDPCTSSGCPAPSTATAITVTNPLQTSGGVDASNETVASASDITNWQEQLGQVENQLGQKAASDLITKAGQEKVAIDPNGGGRSITYVVTPSSFPPATAGTVMTATTVTVTMTAQETLYNPAELNAVVLKDLQASANLPAGDSLVPSQLQLKNVQIIQAGSDGSFALSVSGVDYYHGKVNLSQLASQLSGHSPGSVQGIVQQAIPNVRSVTVDETPIGFLFMPFSSSRIRIVETFVTSSGSG